MIKNLECLSEILCLFSSQNWIENIKDQINVPAYHWYERGCCFGFLVLLCCFFLNSSCISVSNWCRSLWNVLQRDKVLFISKNYFVVFRWIANVKRDSYKIIVLDFIAKFTTHKTVYLLEKQKRNFLFIHRDDSTWFIPPIAYTNQLVFLGGKHFHRK